MKKSQQSSMKSFVSPEGKKRKLPDSVTRGVPQSQLSNGSSGAFFHSRSAPVSRTSTNNSQYSSKFNSGKGDEKTGSRYGKYEPPKEDINAKVFVEELSLSGTQKQVLDMVMKRKSVFFTGAAGKHFKPCFLD